MKAVVVDAALVLAVGATWLACLAFLRLRTPLDRLHCANFVTAAAGAALAVAVWVQDGPSPRAWKVAALWVFSLIMGAASSQAVARALYLRSGDQP